MELDGSFCIKKCDSFETSIIDPTGSPLATRLRRNSNGSSSSLSSLQYTDFSIKCELSPDKNKMKTTRINSYLSNSRYNDSTILLKCETSVLS